MYAHPVTPGSRRMKSLETVTLNDKGGQSYQPLHRFILREVLGCRRVMFMLRVMTYVVSYELYWNLIGVRRFQVVSH